MEATGAWRDWSPGEQIALDAVFTTEELEALAWWMRNKGVV